VARPPPAQRDPSGRLPVTIARNVGQLPVYYYKSPTARLGCVFGPNTPLFPFGYGLGYTRFTYGKPTLDRAEIAPKGTAKAFVTVTNTGSRGGDFRRRQLNPLRIDMASIPHHRKFLPRATTHRLGSLPAIRLVCGFQQRYHSATLR
jgi:hypothetical protein